MRTQLAATLLAAVLGAACAGRSPRVVTTTESGGEVDVRAPVTIRVKSEYTGPLVVYAMTEGRATRLGDVQGSRVEEFRLPSTSIPTNGITLVAVPVGGSARASSGTLLVGPGQTVEFTVGAALTNSAATVRRP